MLWPICLNDQTRYKSEIFTKLEYGLDENDKLHTILITVMQFFSHPWKFQLFRKCYNMMVVKAIPWVTPLLDSFPG